MPCKQLQGGGFLSAPLLQSSTLELNLAQTERHHDRRDVAAAGFPLGNVRKPATTDRMAGEEAGFNTEY